MRIKFGNINPELGIKRIWKILIRIYEFIQKKFNFIKQFISFYKHFNKNLLFILTKINILKKGYLRVTDLGIARIWKPENSQDTSGTPGYMG